VLVTSGGTAEPIDGVRVLTNTSSGYTGMTLAAHFNRCGHEVVLLRARQAMSDGLLDREEAFHTFADLDAALTRLLAAESFDAVVHAAAVGDFGVAAIKTGGVAHSPGQEKLDSSGPVELVLHPHPKLVGQIRARSRNPSVKVIAFKLTTLADAVAVETAVRSLFAESVDLVVHNDLGRRGERPDDFPSTVFAPDGSVLARCASRTELARDLESFLTRPTTTS
jgi:phosphopantothenoylcysteine synthetase/decarboxylase